MGDVLSFDENGDPPPIYELLNWRMNHEKKIQTFVVGIYESNSAKEDIMHIQKSKIKWKGGQNEVSVIFVNLSSPHLYFN